MRKAFVILQWIGVCLLAVFIVWSLVRPEPQPDYQPSTWKSWEGFMALSYQTISREDGVASVSAQRLAKHLAALKQAGFKSIRPRDAVAFLQGKSPLPDKAVLLLFEGGRRETLLKATPVLRKQGFVGTMCVPVCLTERWTNMYLKKNDLEKMSRMAHWDIGSMGYSAIDHISVDEAGTKGHFLSRARWVAGKMEEDDEFCRRVETDYAKAATVLERADEEPAVAYLYPYTDAGSGKGAHPLAASINRKAVAAHHQIAFVAAGGSYNGPHSDPYKLTRLRVSSTWDSTELLKKLQKSFPLPEQGTASFDLDSWHTDGDVQAVEGGLILGDGAAVWLRGSSVWEDVDVGLEVELDPDTALLLYARHIDSRSYLRLRLESEGLFLQERLPEAMVTLARHEIEGYVRGAHKLRLRVKGNRAWMWLDGALVGDPAPLTPVTRWGKIGVASEAGRAEVRGLSVQTIRPLAILLKSGLVNLPELLQEEATVILPVWFTKGSLTLNDRMRQSLFALAAVGVETIPVVELDDDPRSEISEEQAREIASALDKPWVNSLVSHVAISPPDFRLAKALRKKGYSLAWIVTGKGGFELAESGRLSEKDLLVIDEVWDQSDETFEGLLHYVPPSRMMVGLDSEGEAISLPRGLCKLIHFPKPPAGVLKK